VHKGIKKPTYIEKKVFGHIKLV